MPRSRNPTAIIVYFPSNRVEITPFLLAGAMITLNRYLYWWVVFASLGLVVARKRLQTKGKFTGLTSEMIRRVLIWACIIEAILLAISAVLFLNAVLPNIFTPHLEEI